MNLKRYFTILLSGALIIPGSCCFGSKNTSLGGNLHISEYSLRETQVMFCADKCCNTGITVIPQTVVAYNFDDNWVIAKTDSTYDNGLNDFAYWIFRKPSPGKETDPYYSVQANLLGPLDAAAFNRYIAEKNIQLQLLNYPD